MIEVRISPLTIVYVRAGIEPEAVVAADVPGRARRSVAAFGRRLAFAADGLRAWSDLRGDRAFELRDLLASQHRASGRPAARAASSVARS